MHQPALNMIASSSHSWCMTWQTYRDTCMSIRDRFDESKNEHNPVKVSTTLIMHCGLVGLLINQTDDRFYEYLLQSKLK
jgi:hypothetical protein